ncbi:aminoacyl tRNA synthase complex-interacting multifunctional protein 1 [Cynoglossus semilaevis]|uniref:aminoacyl tRNA synthase complex-interacting multifunctional protein 1 n=1 Tax=Cynoglossus semilaevis TaxID=244447 RepID=UPI000495B69B|nr:aminoacyl tRNA synthase complex-interacting multifunctional protein 1-like [Cynoglossus semilaevis]
MDKMDTSDLFHPSLAAAVMKLDPEDGEQILDYFKTQALLTREKALLQASVREQKKLLVENAKLKTDIEQLKFQLQEKQRRRTAKALHLSKTVSPVSTTPVNQPAAPAGATAAPTPLSTAPAPQERREKQGRRRRGDRKACQIIDALSLEPAPRVDASRLDLRVGRILSARRHPLSESMSIQEVDVGENAPRTVVSKLGTKIQLEELQGSLAVLLCNLKACKLKGVVSQGRILCCASSDDCLELLAPPTGSAPGDRVTFLNYPGEPDRELPSKQRIWERLHADLQVDNKGVANYKGCGFEVKGKGLCRAPSLTNCTIR